ncbi:Hemin-binding lipoprotein [Delftia tsuruhatensis]|uniref:extracellular solute-binding protein n=1 Tax=Delftia tsuruhatensis TaxID=180282 RepID=UPI001E79D274|nr:extracellular solute-binding protein [Delftia tsuruhatensis]CAB5711247.1 Hemin-binding lipoprotein [Delftia tsuruhatensis]CAC9686711.1 Hemin-binding lipoprotein [Delftia tsuruhatensis]
MISSLLLASACLPAWGSHAYALWGEPRYAEGFSHFDYVNVKAPKGGELRLVSNLRISTFDKYNPFTIKGSAPAYLTELVFDTLLSPSLDESATGYGLLAEDVQAAPDGLSVIFRLRSEARFHNGKPVLAADVKHSYDTLVGPHALPGYRTLFIDVAGADVLDERTVRFRFRQPNRELPLTVGAIPIFSRDWGVEGGKAKPFDQVITDTPIGSGPYRIGPVRFGKDITYVRDPDYWARDLPVRVGTANFDRISVRIYRDNTARLEALKAGEFDLMRFYSAGDWARRLYGKRFDRGELVKGEFGNKLPSGFQSYVLNTRRPLLKDARVRRALGLALDYEWMNRQMFYGSYQRVQGLFGNTECETHGEPSPEELALMEPLRNSLPPAAFGPMAQPPRTDGDSSLRGNLRQARQLLADAGWTVRDGVLRNARGEAMELEYLDSSESGIRQVSPWIRNLEKLGIRLRFRPVDFALYQQRVEKFDYDIISIAYQGTNNPGQEFADLFGSKAADMEGSGNFPGVKSPAVDALIRRMTEAKTEAQLLPACHALDRAIAHGYYLIPQWSAGTHRMVYDSWRLVRPAVVPPYAKGENWAMETWWARMPALTAPPP